MIKFTGSFETVKSLPRGHAPEYAFVGRSNVGKSSLLNALAGIKIARTSNTPGRTQSLNLFEWDGINIMDLPGYGYARASKTDIERWRNRLVEYLRARKNLHRVFILVDARHGLKNSDLEMMDFCDELGIPYAIVLTKSDKAKKSELTDVLNATRFETAAHNGCDEQIFVTSAEKKTGIEELKEHLLISDF